MTIESMSLSCDVTSTRVPTLRVIAMPKDINAGGTVFGGWLMGQVDLAGGLVATRYAQGRVMTVAVNDFTFIKPVFIDDLVSIYTHITRVGRSSMTVEMEVYVERQGADTQHIRVATSHMVYVAVGEDGKPREIKQPML